MIKKPLVKEIEEPTTTVFLALILEKLDKISLKLDKPKRAKRVKKIRKK